MRTILDDPRYAPWFLHFKPKGPWFSPKCDKNSGKCSDYYHMQEQTPDYPRGDGNCAAPACDCGKSPCGFYMFNHSSTAVVGGQTFREWFIQSYVFNEVGSSPLVSGFFLFVPRPRADGPPRTPPHSPTQLFTTTPPTATTIGRGTATSPTRGPPTAPSAATWA